MSTEGSSTEHGSLTREQLATARWTTGLLTLAAAVLLALLPWQAQHPKDAEAFGQGWWSEPWLASAASLSVMLLSAGLLWLKHRRLSASESAPMGSWLQPVEHALLFGGYLWLLTVAGFALSTLVFSTVAIWRTGITPVRSLVASLLITGAVVVLFRVALNVWFPPAALYKLMPPWLGNFWQVYL